MTPPRSDFDIPLVHVVRKLYKEVYLFGAKISKRNKLGIYSKIENCLVEILSLSIDAAYKPIFAKKSVLENTRIKIETTKQIVRTANEIGVIPEKQYLAWQSSLQEMSKMTNGWLKYLETKNPPR